MSNISYFQSVVIQLDPAGNVVSCQVNLAYRDSDNSLLQGGIAPMVTPTDPSLQSIAIEAQKLIQSVKTSQGIE